MTDNSPVYLMDASAFIHRSFHAIRNLTTKDGRPTGAAYGFTATLLKIIKDKKPQALAVVFDSRGPGHRHSLYPEYKANRGPMDEDLAVQQASIRHIVECLGLYSLERAGFEADDLIAAAARHFAGEGQQVVIVSGDKDFYQLLNDQISMYDPDPKKDSALTREAFRERFGLEPQSFLDMQALMGDSSDNIPGVPKVGEKTAQKLIARYGSLDKIYENLAEVTPEKLRDNLATHRASAYLSKELASLGHGAEADFTLADLRPAEPDRLKLMAIFKDMEFSRLIKELGPDGENSEASVASPIEGHQQVVSYENYTLVDSEEAWASLMVALKEAKVLSIDLETDSPSPSSCALVGLSLCAEAGISFYIPLDHRTLGARNQKWELVAARIGPYLADPALPKIGQNAKFDWLILARHGLELPDPSDDPMLASYLLDPESRHNMDSLSLRFLGHKTILFKDMVPDPKKNFGDLRPEDALDYAAEDADVTLRLAGVLRKNLEKEKNLAVLYQEMELPLEGLLARIERAGVNINEQVLGEISVLLGERLKEMQDKIYAIVGRPFNIGSPKQLSDVLFNELGLAPVKKTAKKTGFSTDDEVLAELALIHPLPVEIRQWRSLDKLKSTYADKLPRMINPLTGRVHTSYNQTLTATGRLSSSEPNLQNIPARSEEGRRIRSAFAAPAGFSIVAADYSQIELRVLAHFSQDDSLLKAFANDEDIHTQTAAEIFGLAPGEVNAGLRREAKTINFGVVYGQGPFALGRQLGIPQAQARDFIERYFARFPGVKRYMEETRELARNNGYVSTWFGRRRFLAGLTGGYQARQEAERMAINTPIQGTAADLIKMAMLKVDGRLRLEHPKARLIMQVHDELVLEVPEGEEEKVARLLREEMSGVAQAPSLSGARPLNTLLKVDVGIGKDWAAAH